MRTGILLVVRVLLVIAPFATVTHDPLAIAGPSNSTSLTPGADGFDWH